MPVDSSLSLVTTQPLPVPAAPASEHEIARTALAAIQAHRDGDWIWRHEIIRLALAAPHGSTERSRIVADLASRSHRTPSGELRRVAASTLYGWIKEYEARGFEGINRRRRADRGRQRVIIKRAWDDAATVDGITPDCARDIATKLLTRTRSLWKEGAPSWRKVQDLATKRLIELSRAAGMDRPIVEMLELCRPSRKMIEREKNHKILATKDKDAKQFFDKYTPRAARNYVGIFPMDMVVVDVHHMDNIKRRENGNVFTPKMICWFDIATNRVFDTIVFVGEGEGVRQEHIAQSFIAMTQDPEWGLPRSLYMDNGSELARLGLADAAMQLANWARKQDLPGMSVGMLDDHAEVKNLYRAVRKSLAYNAPGKPGIEGHFGILERTLAPMMPGWIGGNRMVKKTQNVGKEPTPFEGSEEDFARSVGTLIDYYEVIPQSGKLKGKSPRQTFAAFVDDGWKRIDVDPLVLAMVFSPEKTVTATRGEFRHDNAIWRGDDLLPLLAGTKLNHYQLKLVGLGLGWKP
ncbi:MAG: helix-turn-helix domain-containing protein, partial [Rhodospirillaceae bacterium]